MFFCNAQNFLFLHPLLPSPPLSPCGSYLRGGARWGCRETRVPWWGSLRRLRPGGWGREGVRKRATKETIPPRLHPPPHLLLRRDGRPRVAVPRALAHGRAQRDGGIGHGGRFGFRRQLPTSLLWGCDRKQKTSLPLLLSLPAHTLQHPCIIIRHAERVPPTHHQQSSPRQRCRGGRVAWGGAAPRWCDRHPLPLPWRRRRP